MNLEILLNATRGDTRYKEMVSDFLNVIEQNINDNILNAYSLNTELTELKKKYEGYETAFVELTNFIVPILSDVDLLAKIRKYKYMINNPNETSETPFNPKDNVIPGYQVQSTDSSNPSNVVHTHPITSSTNMQTKSYPIDYCVYAGFFDTLSKDGVRPSNEKLEISINDYNSNSKNSTSNIEEDIVNLIYFEQENDLKNGQIAENLNKLCSSPNINIMPTSEVCPNELSKIICDTKNYDTISKSFDYFTSLSLRNANDENIPIMPESLSNLLDEHGSYIDELYKISNIKNGTDNRKNCAIQREYYATIIESLKRCLTQEITKITDSISSLEKEKIYEFIDYFQSIRDNNEISLPLPLPADLTKEASEELNKLKPMQDGQKINKIISKLEERLKQKSILVDDSTVASTYGQEGESMSVDDSIKNTTDSSDKKSTRNDSSTGNSILMNKNYASSSQSSTGNSILMNENGNGSGQGSQVIDDTLKEPLMINSQDSITFVTSDGIVYVYENGKVMEYEGSLDNIENIREIKLVENDIQIMNKNNTFENLTRENFKDFYPITSSDSDNPNDTDASTKTDKSKESIDKLFSDVKKNAFNILKRIKNGVSSDAITVTGVE